MRLFARFLSAALLTLSPMTAAADELKIAFAPDNPPFAFTAADGSRRGFDVEMADALCAELQSECALLPLAKSKLLAALAAGDADAVIALPAADYGDGFLPSARYYKQGARFARLVGTGGKIAYKRMAGKNVAVVRGSVFDTFLTDKFAGVQVVRHATLDDAYAALAAGAVEYVLDDRARQALRAADDENIETAGPNYSTAKYFSDMVIVVRDEALRQRFNDAIAATRQNGVYQRINSRYVPFDLYGR